MFKFFGEKGQSSSVFNLLIAALVSLAILGLLLTILSGVGVFGGNKPDETAAKLLKSASQKAYMPFVEKATFSKTNNTISSRALAQEVSIGKENIILLNCSSDGQFSEGNTELLTFGGGSSREFQLVGFCGYESITPEEVNLPSDCGGLDPVNNNYTCFVVVTNKVG
jgi:hypothetical protein